MDQCLVDGSPWLFAVTHVLHRFLAPRHPPLALCSLEEQRCSCLLCSSQRAGGGARTSDMFVERGTPLAAGANSVPSPRVTTLLGRLPQNGREDKVRRAGVPRGTNPTIDLPFRLNPPMHQLGVVRIG